MVLLFNLSFKLCNNRFFRWRTGDTVRSFNAGKSLSFSLSFSLTALCHGGTAILPLSVSFTCPCVTVRLQCASPLLWEVSPASQCVGEDFSLAPHLSVAYLNHAHSCHPSHCLPISLLVTCSKIFHLALPCSALFFRTKETFLSLSPR